MTSDNILQTIGNTPIVRLNRVTQGLDTQLFAKLEFMNPGGSIKDRIGYWMIEDAERKGNLKPGGTIVEGTSGNTGVGLAIASAIKGYQCVFVLPDKMSQEKIQNLRAFGAKVVVTPTAVEPEDPRSYYQVSRRLAREIPNALYIDQYNNLSNRECHYQMTGPEILRQMPDIDVLIAGIGTGGTVCGIGKYLREKKPSTQVIAVDPIGSIVYDEFKFKKRVSANPYKIEGIGEDFLPGNYDLSVIHDMVQVQDKESFLMTRDLLKKEGIYSGVSSGAAVVGAIRWIRAEGERLKGKKALVILPDSGNRYLSKVYNDDWMREAGFLETLSLGSVADLLRYMDFDPSSLVSVKPTDKVLSVIETMRSRGISQMPVIDEKGWVKGVVTEAFLLKALYEGRSKPSDSVEPHANPAVEFVTLEDPVEKVARMVTEGKYPLVSDKLKGGKLLALISKIDVLGFLGSRP